MLEVGQIIDEKYRIVRLIGEGGMGAVYEGENVRIRRRVAIKILHTTSASNVDIVARFEREAQAAGRIGNDHILEVLDLGALQSGDRYIIMEYLDGETLLDRIRRSGRLAPEQVAPLARQFLSALRAAHAAGIIHRDLKPENIFILREKAGRRDFVKLIDFGISKFDNLAAGTARVTRAGSVLGTPCYMAPEQARGIGEADVRSDIYAVGVILYEAVTGRLPFDGQSFNDLMFKIALSDPEPPSAIVPTLDPDFEALIVKAMARAAEHRFQSVEELEIALEAWALQKGVPLSESTPHMPAAGKPTVVQGPASAPIRLYQTSGGDDAATSISIDADFDDMGRLPTQTDRGWSQSAPVPPPKPSRRRLAIAAAAAVGVAGLATIFAVRAAFSSNGAASASARTGVAAASAVTTTPRVGLIEPPPPSASVTPLAPPTPLATAPTKLTPLAPLGAPAPSAPTTKRAVASTAAAPLASSPPATPSAKSIKPKATDFGY